MLSGIYIIINITKSPLVYLDYTLMLFFRDHGCNTNKKCFKLEILIIRQAYRSHINGEDKRHFLLNKCVIINDPLDCCRHSTLHLQRLYLEDMRWRMIESVPTILRRTVKNPNNVTYTQLIVHALIFCNSNIKGQCSYNGNKDFNTFEIIAIKMLNKKHRLHANGQNKIVTWYVDILAQMHSQGSVLSIESRLTTSAYLLGIRLLKKLLGILNFDFFQVQTKSNFLTKTILKKDIVFIYTPTPKKKITSPHLKIWSGYGPVLHKRYLLAIFYLLKDKQHLEVLIFNPINTNIK
ncbi:hypothetical protein AGLY_003483 [Aphis glycines]|uniref:Uncharacterized protein n=1 Tax=Aphis glycines TaxID=307491 RepID=A0A6G0U295_APHGL|nr:hypothetical protein AGLY_003483 [Aphis glycines]